METKFKFSIRAACHSFGEAVCASAILLIAFGAQAQNLFVSGTKLTFPPDPPTISSSIIEITPGGAQSTFASGLYHPSGLAFNSAGNLFESDGGSGNIYEFTPDGVQSTFASGLYSPEGLAFDSAGDLFVANGGNGTITEIKPGGAKSTFASGLTKPNGLAIQPVPEPSALGLLAMVVTVLIVWHRRCCATAMLG